MNRRANATKPRTNSSNIVDLQRRHLNSELTVTIPENENVKGTLEPNGEYLERVNTVSLLAQLAENKLMRNFKRVFDQFKIIGSHLCIDVTQAPYFEVQINKVDWTLDNIFYNDGGNWKQYDNANLPEAVVNRLGDYFAPGIKDFSEAVEGQPSKYVELPFTVGCSSRRTIPENYFVSREGQRYSRPTWNEMMSYGSAIWESKLPGAPIHLSMDIQASSNTERSMTFPTEVLDKVCYMTPMLQGGRFCPIYMFGVRIKKLQGNELKNELGLQLNGGDEKHVTLHVGGGMEEDDPAFPCGGNVIRAFVVYNDQRYEFVVRGRYSFGDDVQSEPDYWFEYDDRRVDYCLSVQGYHTCRMKQLRTLLGTELAIYNRIGVNYVIDDGSNNNGAVCRGMIYTDQQQSVPNEPISWTNHTLRYNQEDGIMELVNPPADDTGVFAVIVCYGQGQNIKTRVFGLPGEGTALRKVSWQNLKGQVGNWAIGAERVFLIGIPSVGANGVKDLQIGLTADSQLEISDDMTLCNVALPSDADNGYKYKESLFFATALKLQ